MTDRKRIAVTGGHGKVGKVLIPYLRAQGHQVFCLDQEAPYTLDEPYMQVDLTNFGDTLDGLASVGEDVYARPERKAFDVVIHLASVPHPRMVPDSEEFRLNMMTTYNVFEACRRLGIKDIVWAASEVGIGVPFDQTGAPYVPVDEDYPLRGYNVYALTKVLGEVMAEEFCKNDPELRITCLRLSNVIDTEEYPGFEDWQDDPTQRMWNFWTYIDNRDAAQGIEKALHHAPRGKDAFFITNDDTVMRAPTEALLEAHFPEVERKRRFEGNEVVLTNDKAKRVLGFQPRHNGSQAR
ncbi:epimerase [Thioclava sp. SK-1]|uniref:NAD-dependent epimerase/dehydratase family protein n=1 Tax=Thioclava sp. SK-1 TaxID=1889770 RepID=UPI0008255601|nr:NAD(P)-dependent oxidoreductase [Thioclava sp. SK-1]OCX65711.1 epimerase [Thioclava sp. SK-1]